MGLRTICLLRRRLQEGEVLIVLTQWHPVGRQGHDSKAFRIDEMTSHSLHTFTV